MATLMLETPEPHNDSVPLRQWLRGGWAVLFSHPNDFIRCELEMDRWLAVVRRAFTATRIRPLALAGRAAQAVGSWIAEVSDDTRRVLLAEPRRPQVRSFDLRAAALRAEIEALGTGRFVMVVDDSLYRRRTYTYGTFADVPSPLEFLGWADAARMRQPAYGAPGDAARARWTQRAPGGLQGAGR